MHNVWHPPWTVHWAALESPSRCVALCCGGWSAVGGRDRTDAVATRRHPLSSCPITPLPHPRDRAAQWTDRRRPSSKHRSELGAIASATTELTPDVGANPATPRAVAVYERLSQRLSVLGSRAPTALSRPRATWAARVNVAKFTWGSSSWRFFAIKLGLLPHKGQDV